VLRPCSHFYTSGPSRVHSGARVKVPPTIPQTLPEEQGQRVGGPLLDSLRREMSAIDGHAGDGPEDAPAGDARRGFRYHLVEPLDAQPERRRYRRV
jgi:hypothetical protein